MGPSVMSQINVTLPQGYQKQFNDLLMDHQRRWHRGQFGVSVISPPMGGPDANGEVTFFGVPELVLPLLKDSGIPHKVH
jgi:hypothetical protein